MIVRGKELETYPLINSGGQGKIYQISSNEVIKITETENQDLLTKMQMIPLKQFIKPIGKIEEAFIYPYLPSNDYESILELTKQQLHENIEVLIRDIEKISKERILIHDLIPKNSVCLNQKIYILDFDLYTFAKEELDERTIFKLNLEKLDRYFNSIWIMALVKIGYDRRFFKYNPEYFERDYLGVIENNIKEDENIKQYLKRKIMKLDGI